MWRSGPHSPTVFTRISTSFGPIDGTGTCSSVKPGPALTLRSARIVSGIADPLVGRSAAVEVIAKGLRPGAAASRSGVVPRGAAAFSALPEKDPERAVDGTALLVDAIAPRPRFIDAAVQCDDMLDDVTKLRADGRAERGSRLDRAETRDGKHLHGTTPKRAARKRRE